MPSFEIPVGEYMVCPVLTIDADAGLGVAHRRLLKHNVSSLAVVDDRNELVGVISRSDLVRVGRRHAGARGAAALLTLPDCKVGDEMTSDVMTVSSETPAKTAAHAMVKHRIHRVFVKDGEQLAGVFSTRDIMRLIHDAKANAPISDSMSAPIFTIRADEPVSLAVDRLEKAHVSGLLVVEDDWPVGLFGQAEALESRDAARETPVDEVMNPALVCLPHDTRMHRAAGHVRAMRVRRVVAVKHREAIGILTGLDFARFIAS